VRQVRRLTLFIVFLSLGLGQLDGAPQANGDFTPEQALPLFEVEEELKEDAAMDVELALAPGQEISVNGVEAHAESAGEVS
jgi:hypothetical protein